ncbi:MAG: GNAT family N-acetyltransferase [Armatimonadetes bacterium]|nr:GNAT family N-acetyltransferase [Armatimonadota bacterium]
MEIRRATVDDAREIAEVSKAAWQVAYADILPESVLSAINASERAERLVRQMQDGTAYWVAMDENGVAGFACAGKSHEPSVPADAELYAIYVHPGRQRSGIGGRLLAPVVAYLREEGFEKMCVFVFRDNGPARRFYEKMGARFFDEGTYKVAGVEYPDTSYIWEDLADLEARLL